MSLADLLVRAAQRPARLLLAGGEVEFLQAAATALTRAGVGGVEVVGADLHPERHPRLNSVALLLRSREPNRVHDGIHALDLAGDPLRFACGLLALGDADAVVAGPGTSHQALTVAVDWTIGAPLDGGPVQTASWVLFSSGALVGFADCATSGERSPPSQARLARAVAHTHQRLSGEPARVTFLAGPPDGTRQAPGKEAVECLKAIDPGILAEADSEARFRGGADVLIFPSGAAGYLASRTSRALSGALVLGPLLLGPPGTVAGVSEDSEVDELVGTAALAVLAAGAAAS